MVSGLKRLICWAKEAEPKSINNRKNRYSLYMALNVAIDLAGKMIMISKPLHTRRCIDTATSYV